MGTQYPNPSRSPKTFCIGLRKRTIRTAESPRPGSNDPKYSFRMCCNWHTPSCRMNPRQKPMTRNPTSLPAQCCCSTRHRNIGGYCLGICTTLQVARREPARVRPHATSLSSGGVPSGGGLSFRRVRVGAVLLLALSICLLLALLLSFLFVPRLLSVQMNPRPRGVELLRRSYQYWTLLARVPDVFQAALLFHTISIDKPKPHGRRW